MSCAWVPGALGAPQQARKAPTTGARVPQSRAAVEYQQERVARLRRKGRKYEGDNI